ncbi:hypothetical protein [Wansuia hejianensis]|uniref:Uncharacterized protein n=1 Tax=Wansuia hejianensis TaxID=2763667 RepID=A0A926ILY7_9FIRM|nr:hypothetical protein [Wansuia hejianensis]MBC8590654.1 hypothetical protein [Wansuia hejianensis]
MNKYVEFLNIGYENFNMYQGEEYFESRHKAFINLLKNSFQTKEYMINQNKKEKDPSVVIEIIETNDNFIFGIIGKLNDLSNKTLLRLRGKGIDEIHKTSSPEDLNYYIENFTYFYIRLSDLTCALLQNPSAPSFKKHFLSLLKNETNYKDHFFDDIYIIDQIDSNIPEKLTRFKDIVSLNMGYINQATIDVGDSFLSLENEFDISQSDIEYANVSISLKTGVNQSKMKKKLSSYKKYDDFNKFKVNGIDENDISKCIDLVRNIITQKVSIDIEEKYLMSTDGEEKIKEALKLALNSI